MIAGSENKKCYLALSSCYHNFLKHFNKKFAETSLSFSQTKFAFVVLFYFFWYKDLFSQGKKNGA